MTLLNTVISSRITSIMLRRIVSRGLALGSAVRFGINPLSRLGGIRFNLTLLVVASIGPLIRAIPLTSKYPIGGDSGQYFSLAAAYATSWPFIPSFVGIWGIIPSTSETFPLVPWIMAMLNRVFALDLYDVTKVTPLLVSGFAALAVYFLAKVVTGRRDISLLSALFYGTSKFNLWTVYPAYNLRAEIGVLFIALFFFVVLKQLDGKVRFAWSKNLFIGALLLSAVLASHDYGIFAAFIIFSSFFLVVLGAHGKKIVPVFLPTMLSTGVLGCVLSVPILSLWFPFITQRTMTVSGRLTSEGSLAREMVASHFFDNLPSFPYGYLVTLFGILGAVFILKAFLAPRGRTLGNCLLIAWTVTMFAGANAHYFDIFIVDPPRMMVYVVVPLSILAGQGVMEVLDWVRRVGEELRFSFFRGVIVTLILAMSVALQVQEAAMVTNLSITERPARPYLTEEIEEGMVWIKQNSEEDAIFFIPALAPYIAGEYLPGLTGRVQLFGLHPDVPLSDSAEYLKNLDAQIVMNLLDPQASLQVLERYSQRYPEGYILVGKKDLGWANAYGANVDYDRLSTHYTNVFENGEIVIYKAYPLKNEG